MPLAGASRSHASLIVALMAGVMLCPLGVRATPPLQKRAMDLGFAAADCAFCHTFDIEHMRKRARQTGIANMNCVACHGKRLPKSGRDLLSERGKWLLDEKVRRKARAVDVGWLREYPGPVKHAKTPS